MGEAGTSRRYSQGERVAFFMPCYADMLFPQVGKAVVTLFERLALPFEYPMEQTCCGQPAFNAGYWDEARAVAQHFADVFRPYEWIVVPSGSCAAMCRVFYDYLAHESDAASVGARVCDLATFLVENVGVTDVGARFPHRVTYHDGCHGRRELHAGDAATTLLRAVKDLEYVELPAIEECCGFGGLFSVKFEELSTSMGAQKCANARATGADVLVSGDSSCLMHIGGMLQREDAGPKGPAPHKGPLPHRGPLLQTGLKTMHLAEVLASTS